jgi:hypothetical protein
LNGGGEENEWWYVSDEDRVKVDVETVLNSNAYVLFYEMVGIRKNVYDYLIK